MPALPVVFSRRAAREVETATEWWRLNRPEAGVTVFEALAEGLALISVQPGCGVPTRSHRFRGVRRIYLPRIHHHVYYRFARDPRRLEVLAFWQARRATPAL